MLGDDMPTEEAKPLEGEAAPTPDTWRRAVAMSEAEVVLGEGTRVEEAAPEKGEAVPAGERGVR